MKRATIGHEMFHISAVIDGSILHKMMSLCDGKAIDLKVAAVRTPEQVITAQMTGADFILQFSSDKAEFTNAQLHEAGRAIGLSKQTLYQATSKLVKDRVLRRVSSGVFAPIRLLTGPKTAPVEKPPVKKEQTAAQKARQSIRYEVSNKEMALKFLRRRKTFTTADLVKHFENEKRHAKSASPVISKLKEDGIIEIVKDSDPMKPSYRLTQQHQGNGHAAL